MNRIVSAIKFAFICVLGFFMSSCSEDDIKKIIGDEEGDTVAALKEALVIGSKNASKVLGEEGGYLNDETVKILLPEEAQTSFKAIKAVNKILNSDNAIVKAAVKALDIKIDENLEDVLVQTFNRAAEDAAPGAVDVFASAISNMTLTDGKEILFSQNNEAATDYLKTNTYSGLEDNFAPVVDASLKTVSVMGYTAPDAWSKFSEMNNKLADIVTENKNIIDLAKSTKIIDDTDYNNICSIKAVDSSLGNYVTQKALDGLFKKVALEENKIRTDAAARVTDLLKKVFGQLD